MKELFLAHPYMMFALVSLALLTIDSIASSFAKAIGKRRRP